MTNSIIFDMDGTLFQTNMILEISLEDTFTILREKNVWKGETPIQKYQEIMGVPLPVVWETLLPNCSFEVRIEANDIFHEKLIHNIAIGKGALYPNVIEIFQYLKENDFQIFIASNGLKKYLQAIVKYYHLDEWVTETFSIEDIPSQNKEDLVAKIIGKYKVLKGVVVGDRISDIKAAKGNQLYSIGCQFDFSIEEELIHADEIVKDLIEIKSVVTKLYMKP